METFWSGVVAGYGIAIPVGAIAAYIVALTARTSFLVGGGAGLGAATADGLYASFAVLGGAALADTVSEVAPPLRWVSFVVLLLLAVRIGVVGIREFRFPHMVGMGRRLVEEPGRAYVVLLGATLLNPMTVVYFAALVLGGQADAASALDRVWFVAGAFLASASWQLLLAGGGSVLGRTLTGSRGRLVTALVSATVIAVLAVATVVG